MMLDAVTLFAALVLVSGLLSALLFLSWLQNRAVTALAWWALAYALATVGIALLGARGRIPDFLSIDVANAIARHISHVIGQIRMPVIREHHDATMMTIEHPAFPHVRRQ